MIADGIWPTMLVAYDDMGKIDYDAMEALIEWYIAKGVHGVFALCHSTEIHCLSFEERLSLGRFVVQTVAGRVGVTMSGNVQSDLDCQLMEARAFADTGADAICFIRNRVDADKRYDFARAIDRIVREIPDGVALGMYECPYPYRRYLTMEELSLLASTERFCFVKDTVCDKPTMRGRANVVRGSQLKLFNANCASLLESLRFGYNGFCGVMGNFHPDLYRWMFDHRDDPRADVLDKYLGMMSVIEMRSYPICAKRYLNRFEGLPIRDTCRSVVDAGPATVDDELRDLWELTRVARSMLSA